MRRLALIALVTLSTSAFACGGDDGPGGIAPSSTSSSSSSGSGGAGTGGMATGGDNTGGMATGGMAAGGMGTGGTATGGGMIGVGGGQGACLSCSAFFDACEQGTCPPKSEVCQASFMLLSDVVGCLCNSCIAECEATCTGVGQDASGCSACITTTSTSSCQASWTACQGDT